MLEPFEREAAECALDCESLDEEAIVQSSVDWAKSIRTRMANAVIDTGKFPREKIPFSIFMAGTPGAGKTEWRNNFFSNLPLKLAHIDPDDFRCVLPCYCGSNSHLFQRATSILTDRVLDRAFEKCVSFVLDGTLSSFATASKNLTRSLDKGRFVQIYFIHQDPMYSWNFVKAREVVEGRRITQEVFINSYINCHATIQQILSSENFSKAIRERRMALDVFIKENSPTRKTIWRSNVGEAEFKGAFGRKWTAEELRDKMKDPTS